MKRGAKLAVLLVALLVLVGAWFLAESLSRRQEARQAEEALQGLTDISVGPEEDVTALAWDYFGDKASLSCQDGKWVNANDETCPIDQDAVHALAEAVSSAQATHAIEDVTDMQPYGLADCGFTVIAGTAERIVTYDIGSQASDGSYYVRLDGGDTVYTVPSTLAEAFQIALDDVLQLESAPADIGQLTGLTVQTDAGSYALRRLTEEEEGYWYTDAFPWALLGEDGAPTRPLDTEKAEELCGLVTGISLTTCESWKDKTPAEYGLDTPQGTARADYQDENGADKSFTLEFGDYKDDEVYVRLAGSDMVYRVAGTTLDGLMYPDFDAMEPLTPGALNWDRLQSVYMELDGDTRTVTRSVSTPTGDEEPEDIYTSGEKSLDAKKVADWLEQLSIMTADSRTEPAEGRQMLFRFTFRQDSESFPEVTMEFRAYDSVHYLCIVNGQEHYLVSRTEADSIREGALAFLIDLPTAETSAD